MKEECFENVSEFYGFASFLNVFRCLLTPEKIVQVPRSSDYTLAWLFFLDKIKTTTTFSEKIYTID